MPRNRFDSSHDFPGTKMSRSQNQNLGTETVHHVKTRAAAVSDWDCPLLSFIYWRTGLMSQILRGCSEDAGKRHLPGKGRAKHFGFTPSSRGCSKGSEHSACGSRRFFSRCANVLHRWVQLEQVFSILNVLPAVRCRSSVALPSNRLIPCRWDDELKGYPLFAEPAFVQRALANAASMCNQYPPTHEFA